MEKLLRRFLQLDKLTQCFLIGVLIIIFIVFPFAFILNKISLLNVSIIIIVLIFVIPATIKQNNDDKKEERNLFGSDYENKFNNNIELLKSIIIPLISPAFIFIFFISVFFFTHKIVNSISPMYEQVSNENEIGTWGSFGSYIGGIFGTIITFLTLAATLKMLSLQKEQIDNAREEFKQKQFETTTFTNLLKEIKEQIKIMEKDEKINKQFYQLLQMIFREIHEYSNKDKVIRKKYVDMLKRCITNDCLIKIFLDTAIPTTKNKDNANIYVNIRNIINKYALFQDLELTIDKSDNVYYEKYQISAFTGNNELMPYRVSLETNTKELDNYANHANVSIRQAVASNSNTNDKTLKFLSEDDDTQVRQAVASNPKTPKNILTQLATNDLSDEVRFYALGNSNISVQLLEDELKDKYYKTDEHNIEKMAYIIFNNSQIYNDDIKFNKYMIKIISYLEKKHDNEEYDLRNEKKEKIFKYFEKELNDNIYKNIISLSIDNILNSQYPLTCYLIIQNNNIINKIHSYDNNIYSYDNNIHQIISNNINIIEKMRENQKSTKEQFKAKITSVFKQHEDKLKVFLSQLKEQ